MRLLLTFFVFFTLTPIFLAQGNMSFHYVHAVPQGEFADNLLHQPNGIAFEFTRSLRQSDKIQVGAFFNVSMYQNEDYKGDVDISEFRRAYVETNEDDCYYTYQGIARYLFTKEHSVIRPYMQVQAGGTTFFSTLSINEDAEEAFDGKDKNHGTTWLAGAAGGIMVKVFEGLNIDLSCGYNASGNVEYRASPEMEDIAQYRINLSDHLKESKVDHVVIKLGLNMAF